ncbi:hypothetical protein AMTRI_Chr13g84680 [Amborella trichopoda]|uniref:Uncharacterized protein n=1 Tax=Amborella trichopoda TaxID=13333 RepID=W1PBI2_AMBTC|nr:uncharacterized protein LOC18432550 [Amborella trichopoda]XP_020521851.1 uncharacterized protein LOC18432550 [Amborella trichopoda]ERN04390.1 hypothetical protein AMTR_s00147p00098270 [Amborella trichopoda]|eukprot:XP_006842715.1 uncharacterized protein LOC18432550 [Amborella trichopoda]
MEEENSKNPIKISPLESHIVEIPVDEEHQKPHLSATASSTQHPLHEISESPGHLLLLKLWQREEDLFAHRIAIKETRIDTTRREVFQLCLFFFAFHGFFFTLLFTSSIHLENSSCKKWWVPSCLSLIASLVTICSVQYKLFRYSKVLKQLQRERSDSRALVRCIQELRMKGASFDLSKEPHSSKRFKSSSVEVKLNPIRWCSQNLVTILLLIVTGLIFPACKFIVCG